MAAADGVAGPVETAGVWTIHTDVFEGPLDLLLYLVKRDGVDLRALVVSSITDSYLAYLERMRELNLSIASDYLVMAATLVHLKSLELLPRPPTILEEEEDPREALAEKLAQYQAYKDAAESMADNEWLGRDVFHRPPAKLEGEDRPVVPGIDAFGLLDVYFDLLTKQEAPPTVVAFEGGSGANISDTAKALFERLWAGDGTGQLTQILRGLRTKAERVITFLAVLEMARLGWLGLEQDGFLGEVALITKAGLDEVDFTQLGLSEDEDDAPSDA